jgi:hypothetical protein
VRLDIQVAVVAWQADGVIVVSKSGECESAFAAANVRGKIQ